MRHWLSITLTQLDWKDGKTERYVIKQDGSRSDQDEDLNLFWRSWTSLESIMKALARTAGSTGGEAPNNVLATCWVPGFWLLSAEMATALTSPMLSWKCTRALGNTNTSPFWSVVEINVLLVVMKPTKRVPSMSTKISVARGWVWGGLRPRGAAKSSRTMEIPKVLRPGSCITLAWVTLNPNWLLVSPALSKPFNTKSSAVTIMAFLQGNPFTITAQFKSWCYSIYEHLITYATWDIRGEPVDNNCKIEIMM